MRKERKGEKKYNGEMEQGRKCNERSRERREKGRTGMKKGRE